MITYSLRDQTVHNFALLVSKTRLFERIYLFGSTSRRDDRLDSDIDIALIGHLERIDYTIREEINNIASEFLVNHGIVINWIYFSKQEWVHNAIPLIKTIKQEGVLIWEKEKTKLR